MSVKVHMAMFRKMHNKIKYKSRWIIIECVMNFLHSQGNRSDVRHNHARKGEDRNDYKD